MTINEMANKLVSENLYYNISSLFGDLIKLVGSANRDVLEQVSVDDEQLMALSVIDDWEEPAAEYARALDREDLVNELELKGIEFDPAEDDEALVKKLLAHLEEEDEFQEFCSDNRLDPHTSEVYEHWIVSDWFAARLSEKGERTDTDVCGMTVWGRTTTGQAAYMDWVVQQIAKDLLERE